MEEGGFLYDSDAYNDKLLFDHVAGHPHLVVPYSLVTNDVKFTSGLFSGDDFFTLLRNAFDVLYAEGAKQPKMMSVGLHPRLVGHPRPHGGPHPLRGLRCRRQSGVWACRRSDIARHWAQRHPALVAG